MVFNKKKEEYQKQKEKRAEQARRHTEKMEHQYHKDIKWSGLNTSIYTTDFKCNKTDTLESEIIVEDSDSVTAIFSHSNNGKTAVLNFASYTSPGGGFINGSRAQEECLCHESSLYSVLLRFPRFYSWNNQHRNSSLYLNRALYTPEIVFIRDNTTCMCDVITCAAPNKHVAQKYENITDKENSAALRDRIKFVLDVARENEVKTLILGAFGCGVFGQDPIEVADIFKEYLSNTHKCFERVVFAIPKGQDGNLEAFMNMFHIE